MLQSVLSNQDGKAFMMWKQHTKRTCAEVHFSLVLIFFQCISDTYNDVVFHLLFHSLQLNLVYTFSQLMTRLEVTMLTCGLL